MNVGYRLDSDRGQPFTQAIALTPGGSLWGTLQWGGGVWSPGYDEGEKILSLANARGQRIQFYFSNQNTAGQKFKIIRAQFSYNNKGRRYQ
jgi:hypothetical protein